MKPRNVGEQLLQPCLLDRLQDETPALDNATARLRKLQEDRERVAKEGKAPTADLEERLFVALTDVRELQERVSRTVFTEQHLRQSVLRDLATLLSTTAFESVQTLDAHPQTRTSVLNYGIRGQTGSATGLPSMQFLETAIRESILAFEPRVLRDTLEVRITKSDEDELNRLAIEISGDIWGQPLPQVLYLRSLLDVETGDVLLSQDALN